MPTPVANLGLMSLAAAVALASSAMAWRAWWSRAVGDEESRQELSSPRAARVLLPLIAALPGLVLALLLDPLIAGENAARLEVPLWFRTWPVMGLPAIAAVLGLGFVMLVSPRAARPRVADGATLGAGAALVLLLIAAGRVHLLEAQLLLLGAFVLWWCQISEPGEPSPSDTHAARNGGGTLWILLSLASAGATGWLASRALAEPRLIPLVIGVLAIYGAASVTIPVWATVRARRASAVPTAIGVGAVLLPVGVALGVGTLAMTRVVADAARQVTRAHVESLMGIATEVAESLIARPYIGGLSPSAIEAGIAGVAAISIWIFGMITGRPSTGLGHDPVGRRVLTVALGVALLTGSLWMILTRMHASASIGGMP
ncbi:MAG TPA: hypothetical protein VG797_00345 [Phycisphaerales bacterium]|nr:hypothetical protein [Phycisphaerales bacterium]